MKWSQENGESMWVSVPEQKSQIKIEQQPYDDSVTVKHLQRKDREQEKRERERYIMGCKGQMVKQTGDKETERNG